MEWLRQHHEGCSLYKSDIDEEQFKELPEKFLNVLPNILDILSAGQNYGDLKFATDKM